MLITHIQRVIEAYRKYRQGICKLYDTVYFMMWLRFSELLYIVPSGNMAERLVVLVSSPRMIEVRALVGQ